MIVDRYLSREIVKYSLTGLLVFTFSFMTGKIFRVTEMVLDRGIPFFYALKFMLLLTPSFLVFVIPMALLLGVLLALSRMSADREVLALKTSGVGAQRFLRPVLAVALVAT
ncbi:MAG: LPS export ABC transporter permease LptF, partial [Deltaproteobacteria bacterium]